MLEQVREKMHESMRGVAKHQHDIRQLDLAKEAAEREKEHKVPSLQSCPSEALNRANFSSYRLPPHSDSLHAACVAALP